MACLGILSCRRMAKKLTNGPTYFTDRYLKYALQKQMFLPTKNPMKPLNLILFYLVLNFFEKVSTNFGSGKPRSDFGCWYSYVISVWSLKWFAVDKISIKLQLPGKSRLNLSIMLLWIDMPFSLTKHISWWNCLADCTLQKGFRSYSPRVATYNHLAWSFCYWNETSCASPHV